LQRTVGLYYTGAVTIKSLKVEKQDTMDFMNRNTQPQSAHQSASAAAPTGASSNGASSAKQSRPREDGRRPGKLVRAGAIALLFALTILVVAVIGVIYVGNSDDQSKFVNKDNYQGSS